MTRAAPLLLAACFLALPAAADTLVLPADALPRLGPATATYRLDAPRSGAGRLDLEWTDGAGRVVERRTQPVTLTDQAEIPVPVDLRRAVVARNTLRASLALFGDAPYRSEAQAAFVAAPAGSGWSDYQVMMWQGGSAARYEALRRLGITAATVTGLRGAVPTGELQQRIGPVLDADLRFYPENIATDFYAPYHRWTPDHSDVTWLWLETLRRFRENPADPTVFHREPSLSDPAWRESTARRLRDTVRSLRPYRPIFYNLADEPGIADLSSFWDFDRSPPSLAAFRLHLRRSYGSLEALNHQWGTGFPSWDAVEPEGTAAALARQDDNFSSWLDFRTWMDIAFADALRDGTDAVHEADRNALSGIEGGQIPGTGGWDYARLSQAVDVLEMYEAGSNVAMARSFNPRLKILSTSFSGGRDGVWRMWRSLLLGGAGMVIWDDASDFVAADGTPSRRAQEMSPALLEFAAGLGAQLAASRPAQDRVAILYSDPSHRLRWLLDRRVDPRPWTDRGSEAEAITDDALRRSIQAATDSLAHLGVQPRFLSPALLEGGALRRGAGRADPPALLLLPQALALSDREAAEIAGFVQAGGTVLADGPAGSHDGHGRRRAVPALPQPPPIPAGQDAMAAALQQAGAAPGLRLQRQDGSPVRDVQIHRLRNGGVTLIGLQRDLTASARQAETLVLALDRPAALHDLRRPDARPPATQHAIALPADAPVVVALAEAPLPPPALTGPRELRAGSTAVWRLTMAGDSPAAAHALQIEVTDPSGQPAPLYSGTLVLRGRAAVWAVPFALNDPTGTWRVRLTDRLGGGVAQASVELR